MAISTTKIPDLVMPTYNPITAVLTSSNIGEDKFRYVTQIMSGNTPFASGNTAEIARLRTVPDLNNRGIVRLEEVLKQYVDYTLSGITTSTGDTFSTVEPFWLTYQLRFGEEYLFKWNFDHLEGNSTTTTISSTTTDHIWVTGDRVQVDLFTGTQFLQISGVSTITKLNDRAIQFDTPFVSGSYTGGTVYFANQSTTQFLSGNNTTNLYCFNGGQGMREWNTFDFSRYHIHTANTGSNASKLLTTFSGTPVQHDDYFNCYAFHSGSSSAYIGFLSVSAYTGTSLVAPVVSTIQRDTSYASDDHHCYSIGIGPANLNAATLATGTQPSVPGDTSFYEIELQDDFGVKSSETLRFNIRQTACTKFDEYKFVYQNKLGSWSILRFTLRSRLNVNKEFESFEKQRLQYIPSSNKFGFNDNERGETVNYINTDEVITVHSDWLNIKENLNYKEMMESAEVYQDYNGTLLPVVIINTSWEQKKKNNENLIQYSIRFRYANKDQIFIF